MAETNERTEAVRVGLRLREEVIAPLMAGFQKRLAKEKRLSLEVFQSAYAELLRKAIRGCCALHEVRDFGDIYFHQRVIFFAHFCEAINSALDARFAHRLAIVDLEQESALSVIAIRERVIRRYFKTPSEAKIFYFFAATAKDMYRLRFLDANRFATPADILAPPGSKPPR